MAWVDVSGSNGVWQYENAATAANSYTDSAAGANSTVSGGIRTHTRPGTNAVTKTYLRTRKKGQINHFANFPMNGIFSFGAKFIDLDNDYFPD